MLHLSDAKKTQTIARVRIHIERVIRQVKKCYHILHDVVLLTTTGSINQIWLVCWMLTNFHRKLINEDGTDID